jgi:hypothetical protein
MAENVAVDFIACQKSFTAGIWAPDPVMVIDPWYSHIRISSPRVGNIRSNISA